MNRKEIKGGFKALGILFSVIALFGFPLYLAVDMDSPWLAIYLTCFYWVALIFWGGAKSSRLRK